MKKDVAAYFRKIGKKGAKSRWANSTKKERSAHARKMALASHKNRNPQFATKSA